MDKADVALGNVIGSNIFNVLFILGLCALVLPLKVSKQIIKQDIPLLFGLSVLVYLLALDGLISRINGLVLLAILVVYLIWLIVQNKTNQQDVSEASSQPATSKPAHILLDILLIVVGLIGLILGSNWLVNSSVEIASAFGVSELVIGLTIVAVGTSLPEVVTSIVAVFNKQRDIAVGNVVGSNIFNLLAVLGLTGVVSKTDIPVDSSLIYFEFPMLVLVALICLPIVFTGKLISRQEGATLFVFYIAYVTYVVLRAIEHPLLQHFTYAIVYFALPLTLLVLFSAAFKHWRSDT